MLAGDPRQLGPVLRSPLAQKHGLGYSLLERLLTYNNLYKKGPEGYDPQFITKLLRNYRYGPPAFSPCLFPSFLQFSSLPEAGTHSPVNPRCDVAGLYLGRSKALSHHCSQWSLT